MVCRNADGKEIHKPIEEIEVGDEVLSYDEETGEQGYKPVVRLFRNQTKEWYHVFVDGEEIRCTGEHPFYVKGKGFIPAKGLKSGDKCLLSTGEDVTIERLELEALTEAESTYNFEVADSHTYYVTDKDVLVHNKCWEWGKGTYESAEKSLRQHFMDHGAEVGASSVENILIWLLIMLTRF